MVFLLGARLRRCSSPVGSGIVVDEAVDRFVVIDAVSLDRAEESRGVLLAVLSSSVVEAAVGDDSGDHVGVVASSTGWAKISSFQARFASHFSAIDAVFVVGFDTGDSIDDDDGGFAELADVGVTRGMELLGPLLVDFSSISAVALYFGFVNEGPRGELADTSLLDLAEA